MTNIVRAPGVLLLAAVVTLTGGCRGKDREGPQGVKVGFVPADGASAHAQAVEAAARGIAEERGFELIKADPRGKAADQAQAVTQLLQKEVSVILIDPIDARKLEPALKKANDAKVYLVTMQGTAPGADVATKVHYNQELAGQLAADYIGHRLPSGGKVAVLRGTEFPQTEERVRAFKAYLEQKHPSVQVVADVPGGAGQAARLLKDNPGLAAVFATDDRAALAVVAAGSGTGAPFVVGYGGLPEAVEEVKKGNSPLVMTVGVFPQRLGQSAARQAWRIVSNKQAAADVSFPPLPVTKDNYGSFVGWKEDPPRDLTIPWESELELKVAREQ